MSRNLCFRPNSDEVGERLDVATAVRSADLSRTLVRRLILDGKVLVNGVPAKPAYRLLAGDLVEAVLQPPPSLTASPEDIPLRVLYRDEDVAVVDKPAGLVVHPAAGHRSGTLANALTAMFPGARGVGSDDRPGIVHRLDKDTSGLMVIALTPRAQISLQAQISARTAKREYLALCSGQPSARSAVIDIPIGRDPASRKRMSAYGLAPRAARTTYRVVEEFAAFTLVDARLQTGRTHQIRVHFAAIGHPLAGDTLYGGPVVSGLDRQFLHAHCLAFDSPGTGARVSVRSPLPEDLSSVLARLRSTAVSNATGDIRA